MLYFTPASGLNSKVVTTGPGWICATWPSTENSLHLTSSWWARSISSRSSIFRSTLGASSSASGGSVNVPGFRCAGALGGSGSGSSDGVSSFLRATTGGTAREDAGGSHGLQRGLAGAFAGIGRRGPDRHLRRRAAFLGVLGDHLAARLLAAPLVHIAAHQPQAALRQVARAGRRGLEHAAERELGRQDHRQHHHRQQHDDRPGAVEIVREHGAEPGAHRSAGVEGGGGQLGAAQHQAEERARARQQERGAEGLGVGGLGRLAPEVVPADDANRARQQVRRVAEQLERDLRQERADAADEIGRRVGGVGGEEPHRIGRLVRHERNQPDQGEREQRHAQELADPPGKRRVSHRVRSPSESAAPAAAGPSVS